MNDEETNDVASDADVIYDMRQEILHLHDQIRSLEAQLSDMQREVQDAWREGHEEGLAKGYDEGVLQTSYLS